VRNIVRKIGKMLFDNADVKTNFDAMKNDGVRTVETKRDDKIDVVENVEVIIAEDAAVDTKDVEIDEE
jgi:hypothetical protein